MKKYLLLFLLVHFITFNCYSTELSEYAVNDDDLIISSITINGNKLAGSVDLYPIKNNYLVAIEPLFDILGLKYEVDNSTLTVWKKNLKHSYFFKEKSTKTKQVHWANDGYYQFIDLNVLNELFEIETIYRSNLLSLEITTKSYQFPVTVLGEQKLDRYSDKLSVLYSDKQKSTHEIITIPDEYQLFTLPHGQISGGLNYDKNNKNYNVNAQIVSDFLYHSMSLNVNKTKVGDLSGGITLSKYKSSPNEKLLGAFDRYSLGDVSGFSSELVSNVGSGVGIVLDKSPDNYRRSNNETTIEEQAPPGWDVELFHNNRFVDSKVVPQTGRVIFKNVLVEWGANEYELRLYGPFGEKEIITKNYMLDSNPLSGGQLAYGLYVLDPDNTVFNNGRERSKTELDNYGMSVDYGITDMWQVGIGFNQINNPFSVLLDDEKILTLKNYLSFPGMLFESNFAMNNNDGYAQLTSVTGNLAARGRYYLSYTSAKDFKSGRIVSPGGKFEELQATYSDIIGWVPISFNYNFREDQYIKSQSIANTLTYGFEDFRLTNRLSYTESLFKQTELAESDRFLGGMNLSTTLFDALRITGSLNYQPTESDFISDTSSLNAQWSYRSDSNTIHNVSFKYLPILRTKNRWNANYNVSWVNDDYRLSLSALYSENDNWSVGINLHFFLGYDYHNNRALMSSNLNSHSATLHVNTYLDRQLNGIRDPLDYPIEGAQFVGNSNWSNITSGKSGYTALPGVQVRAPTRFRAKWKNGSKAINNDYVIYTHPGASINVNMPFYLEVELAGFVYTQTGRADLPAKGIEVELIDKNNIVVQNIKTDSDGYYEFLNIKPNQYIIRVSKKSLQSKNLGADVIGYTINTPTTGGFTELPDFLLSKNSSVKLKNKILTLDVGELSEPLIWSDDEQTQKNYFLMPLKNKEVSAPHQINKVDIADTKKTFSSNNELPINTNDIADEDTVKVASVTNVDNELYVVQLAAFTSKDAAREFIDNYVIGSVKPLLAAVSSAHDNYQFIYKIILSAHETKLLAEKYVADNTINYQDYIIVKLKESALNLNAKQLIKLKTTNTKQTLITPEDTPKGTETILKKTGWVIQYYAGKSMSYKKHLNGFGRVDKLHQGEKILPTTGETYYCLLSEFFETKEKALKFNERSLIKGWVVPSSMFDKIIKVENSYE